MIEARRKETEQQANENVCSFEASRRRQGPGGSFSLTQNRKKGNLDLAPGLGSSTTPAAIRKLSCLLTQRFRDPIVN